MKLGESFRRFTDDNHEYGWFRQLLCRFYEDHGLREPGGVIFGLPKAFMGWDDPNTKLESMTFSFIQDSGVYRLARFGGLILLSPGAEGEYEANSLLNTLTTLYGEPTKGQQLRGKPVGGFLTISDSIWYWNVGEHPTTQVVMMPTKTMDRKAFRLVWSEDDLAQKFEADGGQPLINLDPLY